MHELEASLRASFDAGDYGRVVDEAVRTYGPQVLGFLLSLTNDEQVASEVFAQFCEDFWRGLPGFAWQSTLRTWAYSVARNAHRRYLRDPWVRRAKPLATPVLSALEERVRTATLPYLRTETKHRFARLRERLSLDDQTLLILRVDRKMGWSDVARVLTDEVEAGEQGALDRKAAALRKRFQRVKEELVEMARAEGLLDA